MLKLIRASGLATVQDAGRRGYLSQGVPVSGVLDTLSFKMANMALGNSEEAACIEFMGRFDWVCAEPCVVMLASRHGRMTVNKLDKQSGQLVELQDGDIIQIESQPYAPWGLFCMAGGVQVPLVMGSRSTCSVAAFGGYLGRTLRSGDVIRAGVNPVTETPQKGMHAQRRLALPSSVGEGAQLVRFIIGPDFPTLPSQTQNEFTQQTYRVSSQASRMGYRLDGMPLELGALNSGPLLRSTTRFDSIAAFWLPNCVVGRCPSHRRLPAIGYSYTSRFVEVCTLGIGPAFEVCTCQL